ncbi:hypothetical protein HK101_007351 [Irineochytrium annulatum]|nr:hypothetical protein HK101_007351 [Irineochytrium annulatum]
MYTAIDTPTDGWLGRAVSLLGRRSREVIISACLCLIVLATAAILYPQATEIRLADAADAGEPAPSQPANHLLQPPEADSWEFANLPPSLSPSPSPHPQPAHPSLPPSPSHPPPSKCNLYDHPGRLHLPSLSWMPIGPTARGCEAERTRAATSPASIDRLSRLADSSFHGGRLPAYLSNRLLLIVGDSNDRNTVEDICWNVGGSIKYHYADGREISDSERAVGDAWNLGDSMSCVVNPGKGFLNWEAARRREQALQTMWEQHYAQEVARGGGVAPQKMVDGNIKRMLAKARKDASERMRTEALRNDAGWGGAVAVVAETFVAEAAVVGEDTTTWDADDAVGPGYAPQEQREPSKELPLDAESHWDIDLNESSNIRRQAVTSATSEAEAFAIVYVFNYGIGLDIPYWAAQDHARPGNGAYFNDTVRVASTLVDAIAPHRFPELLHKKNTEAVIPPPAPDRRQLPDIVSEIQPSTNRLIKPSLIMSQSSFWELAFWRHQMSEWGVQGTEEEQIEAALAFGFARLDSDIKRTYLHSLHTHFPGSPIAWRTCPPPMQAYRFPWTIRNYNEFMVEFGAREGLRVLDWEKVVMGRFWNVDWYHQGVEGTLAYAQLMLAELEGMYA